MGIQLFPFSRCSCPCLRMNVKAPKSTYISLFDSRKPCYVNTLTAGYKEEFPITDMFERSVWTFGAPSATNQSRQVEAPDGNLVKLHILWKQTVFILHDWRSKRRIRDVWIAPSGKRKSAPEMTSNISNLERILVEVNSRRRQNSLWLC